MIFLYMFESTLIWLSPQNFLTNTDNSAFHELQAKPNAENLNEVNMLLWPIPLLHQNQNEILPANIINSEQYD